jgi:SAM-dependent methyltransferase
MPDASAALHEFHRVLRPGGRIVITDVYARNPDALNQSDPQFPSCISGILEKDRTIRQVTNAGFDLDSWEDHSGVLTTFIARFIFEYGSLDALWGDRAEAPRWGEQMKRLRPGYALLVARKGEERNNNA